MRSESGFTLVELLMVMVIIGLLAAIAIPAFFSQRSKANDASAKEAVRAAQEALETYVTDNSGSYLTADAPKLRAIEQTIPVAGGDPVHQRAHGREQDVHGRGHREDDPQPVLDSSCGGWHAQLPVREVRARARRLHDQRRRLDGHLELTGSQDSSGVRGVPMGDW